jgi:hypothetical protein
MQTHPFLRLKLARRHNTSGGGLSGFPHKRCQSEPCIVCHNPGSATENACFASRLRRQSFCTRSRSRSGCRSDCLPNAASRKTRQPQARLSKPGEAPRLWQIWIGDVYLVFPWSNFIHYARHCQGKNDDTREIFAL